MPSTSRSACSGMPSRSSTTRRTRRSSPRSCARRPPPASRWRPPTCGRWGPEPCAGSPGSCRSTAPPTSPWSTGWPTPWRRAARTARGRGRTARIALGHRRLRIIDLSERGAQPMVDSELGLAVVFNGCIYNHRELRARARGRRAALLLRQRHRGGAQGLPPLGRALRRSLQGDVRLRHRRARQRPARARARPPRRQAAVPGRRPGGRCASPRPSPRCCAPATSTPRSIAWRCITTSAGTRSCRRRARSWPACASWRPPPCSPSSRTAGVQHRVLGPALRARPGAGGLGAGGLAGRDARGAARRGRSPHGGRRPRGRPALGRPGLEPHRRPARAGGAARACRPSASASPPPAGARATSSPTPTWWPSASRPTTARSGSTTIACCRPCTRRWAP